MSRPIAIVLFTVLAFPVLGQMTLTLDSCLEATFHNFQFQRQAAIYNEMQAYAQRNAMKSWLPQLTLDGTFTYQNEQPSISIDAPFPGISAPEVPLHFARMLVNFTQAVYDGNYAVNRKMLEITKHEAMQDELVAEQLKLKSQVTALYMSVLLAETSGKILRIKRETLNRNIEVVENASRLGSVPAVEVKVLKAEWHKLNQKIIEADAAWQSLAASLAILTGLPIDSATRFSLPAVDVVMPPDISGHPGLTLLETRPQLLERQLKLLTSSRLPRAGIFGSAGMGCRDTTSSSTAFARWH